MAGAAERAAWALLLLATRCAAGDCTLAMQATGSTDATGRLELRAEVHDPGGAHWVAVAWVLRTPEASHGSGGFRWQRGRDWVAGLIDWRRITDTELQLVYRVDEVGGDLAGWNGTGHSRVRLDGLHAADERGQLVLWSAGPGGCTAAAR